MDPHRVWKLIKDLGRRAGSPSFTRMRSAMSCGVELLMRSGGNLRVVQEHLRHHDIGTTVKYTRLAQTDLQRAICVFDTGGHGNNGTQPAHRGTDKQRG